MIEVREAEFSDVAAMREVAIQSYVDTFASVNTPENMSAFLSDAYSQEKLEQEFHETGSVLYLGCESKRIAGFLRLRRKKSSKPDIM